MKASELTNRYNPKLTDWRAETHCKRTQMEEAIKKIKEAGFDVYVHQHAGRYGGEKITYAYYSDGQSIGYIQRSGLGGYDISTVHKANHSSGTGFSIERGISLSQLTKANLEQGFVFAPSWAVETKSVNKWKDMDAFLSANTWNKGFYKV